MRACRAFLVLLASALAVRADGPTIVVVPAAVRDGPVIDIIPVGCSSCVRPLPPTSSPPPIVLRLRPVPAPGEPSYHATPLPPDGPPPIDCCTRVPCYPGQTPCHPYEGHSFVGRFLHGVYECTCCPDPCYEPKWSPLADAGFFTEAVRPVKQTRLRYDSGQNVLFPDRNEYFWARADGNGKGPGPKDPFRGETRLRYNDAVLVTEGGTPGVSVIVETRYRSLQAEQFGHAGGFADLVLGTKSLFFDCELVQIATLFKTYLPTGAFSKGLGTGHLALEPGLLVGVRVGPVTYLQSQVSQWIPIGGDGDHAGGVLRWSASLNHELVRFVPEVPLIGTLEYGGIGFQDGLYSDPFLGPHKSSGQCYHSVGLGVRLYMCDKWDIGFGATFALGREHLEREFYRTEFRMRF